MILQKIQLCLPYGGIYHNTTGSCKRTDEAGYGMVSDGEAHEHLAASCHN